MPGGAANEASRLALSVISVQLSARRVPAAAAMRQGDADPIVATAAGAVADVQRTSAIVGGTRGSARLETVGGTGLAGDPGAVLIDVAFVGTGRSTEEAARLHHVGGTGRARPIAGLRRVTDIPGASAADRPRVAGRMLTGGIHAVALVERARVTVGRARRPRRLLRVGQTVRAVSRAVLGEVALARGRAADGGRGLEAVGGAGRARARTDLRRVAGAGRGAAHRARVPRGVLAGVVRAVALIEAARVAVVGAGGGRSLLGIGRTVGARAA